MFRRPSKPGVDPATRAALVRLQAALEGAPLWLFEQDLRLRYTWLQNADTQGDGGRVTDRDLMEHVEDAEQVEAIKARVLATGEPETTELRASSAGVPHRYRLSLRPIRDDRGKVTGLRGTSLDLGPEVADTSSAAHPGEILRLVGHELRNAVNPVRMALQLMARRRASDEPERAFDALDTAHAGVERLTRVLEDMLDYARSTSEPISVDLVSVSVDVALEAALRRFRSLHPASTDRLVIAPCPPGIAVRADARRLSQCLAALLERSIRNVGRQGLVRLQVHPTESEVTFEITDDGRPLPAEGQAAIDDPVAWAAACLAGQRDEPPFTFALAATLTEAMGGGLTVAAGPEGRGTTIRFHLPRALRALARPRTPIPQVGPPRQILVVDDSPGATTTLRRLLETDGHTVAEAQTGRDCLERISGAKFDVVLLDLGLPDLSGYAVAKQIRDGTGPIPILVALTGRSSEGDRRDGLKAGFDHYLVKPADLSTLRRLLSDL